ncbi:hypothetical protein ACQBAT_07405 [Ornithinimicrobium sp. Y1847]|uniref:hypothetical protein n=1 Tax=unclassified Ornithinimicrobium TaxID=2615080 RepID=UPI003B673EB5
MTGLRALTARAETYAPVTRTQIPEPTTGVPARLAVRTVVDNPAEIGAGLT